MPRFRSKVRDAQLKVVVRLSREEIINEREMDFFTKQYVRGLFQMRKRRNRILDYYGPIGISLYDRLKKNISKHDFLFLIEMIIDLSKNMNLCGLSMNKLVLDIKHVYINEITKELRFIYLPLETVKDNKNIFCFFDSIIYSARPMDESDMDYISRFTYYIRSLTTYDLDQIEQFIMNEDRSIVYEIRRGPQKNMEYYTQNNIYQNDYSGDDSTGLLDDESTGLLNQYDENTGLLDEESTGILYEAKTQIVYPKLYRVLTGETIIINKPVFRIGKERSYTDYFVNDNAAVSRNHADIVVRENRFFVIDLNSKNRTFINNQVIPVRQETEICDGDKLRLANEEFVFYAE